MKTRICLFVSTNAWDLVSWLIRFFTLCAWSHCGWYDRETGLTFSAMSDGKGLAWRKVGRHQKMMLLECPFAAETLALAEQHAGTPYDFLDILGMIFHQTWSRPGHLICDVAVFKFYEEFGHPLLNPTFVPRVHMTPRDILVSPYVTQAA